MSIPRFVPSLLAAALLGGALSPALASDVAADGVRIEVLSNRADLISGGDALVEVLVPSDADGDPVVTVDGRDVTDAFSRGDDGRLIGLVTGLELGANVLQSESPDGHGARITIDNHPIQGPIFSGPHLEPWYCLPDALDEFCNRDVAYSWQYKSMAGALLPYNPDAPTPDVATTTTDEGVTVPYIVRVETGIIDRSEYRIAVLVDPAEEWSSPDGPAAWNHKVHMTHGGGCGMGHSEGPAPDVLVDQALGLGFAVMSTALESNTENCNVLLQAESVMMAKERLIEQYGEVRYLFGYGCSGGSIAQNRMANSYPGLYDGLIDACTYPDIPLMDLGDCTSFVRYFNDPTRWDPGVIWTERDQAAAAGLASMSVCLAWEGTFTAMYNPRTGTECDIPTEEPEKVYDPETNPEGYRCSVQDHEINTYGQRPPERWGPVEQEIGRGFANRPYDTVGIEFGLRALLSGDISPAQFVDLNANIGSHDIDFDTIPGRAEADPAALPTIYRSSNMNMGNNLDTIPIIDIPSPSGDNYEIHDIYKSWAFRERMQEWNGHDDNHVIWYGPPVRPSPLLPPNPLDEPLGIPDPFLVMDEWLAAIHGDASGLPLDVKVVENKPEWARDVCDLPTPETCAEGFAPAGNIRWAAGNSLANDIVKCQLKPLRRVDHAPAVFTDAQWERLEAAFPHGVCDWTKHGVGQQPGVAWMTYENGPHGRPMGPAPVSVAYGPSGAAQCNDLPTSGGGLVALGAIAVAAATLRQRRQRGAS